jgi:hypothetical protein
VLAEEGEMEEANRAADERARQAAEKRAKEADPFGPCYAVSAEGARIGFMTCKECGACVLLGAEVDAPKVHAKWHEKLRHKKALRGGQ